MILCPQCHKMVSYSSYFRGYLCSCGWTKYQDAVEAMEEELRGPVDPSASTAGNGDCQPRTSWAST